MGDPALATCRYRTVAYYSVAASGSMRSDSTTNQLNRVGSLRGAESRIVNVSASRFLLTQNALSCRLTNGVTTTTVP